MSAISPVSLSLSEKSPSSPAALLPFFVWIITLESLYVMLLNILVIIIPLYQISPNFNNLVIDYPLTPNDGTTELET